MKELNSKHVKIVFINVNHVKVKIYINLIFYIDDHECLTCPSQFRLLVAPGNKECECETDYVEAGGILCASIKYTLNCDSYDMIFENFENSFLSTSWS